MKTGDVCAAEAIDRLFGIADDTEDVVGRRKEGADEGMLNRARILKFVDDDLAVLALVVGEDLDMFLEE